MKRWIETFCIGRLREAALSLLFANEIPSDEPIGTTPVIGNCVSLEKSWILVEASVPLESSLNVGPKAQRKLGFSHPAFPNAELSWEHPGIAEARDEPGAARLAHQTPKVKKKTRLKATNVFKT